MRGSVNACLSHPIGQTVHTLAQLAVSDALTTLEKIPCDAIRHIGSRGIEQRADIRWQGLGFDFTIALLDCWNWDVEYVLSGHLLAPKSLREVLLGFSAS